MRIRLERLALVLVAALSVAACGQSTITPAPAASTAAGTVPPSAPAASVAPAASGASGALESVAPSPAGTEQPSTAPAALTMADAKRTYASIARTYNQTLNRAQKVLGSKTTLAANVRFFKTMAAADDAFIDAIKAQHWPSDVAGDIKALTRANIVLQRTEKELSRAPTIAKVNSLLGELERQSNRAADAAAIVRDDLGLPPNS